MVSFTISVNKTMLGSSLSQMFDLFVCILCWTTFSTMFQFYWWRKRRSTRRNHRPIENQWPTLSLNNYITSVFHWNVTIWLAMKWSHDYKRNVSHPNETQIRTCTCLHDDVVISNSKSTTNKIHNEKFNYIKFWCDLNISNVLRSTLSYPNETSKECIQFLNVVSSTPRHEQG